LFCLFFANPCNSFATMFAEILVKSLNNFCLNFRSLPLQFLEGKIFESFKPFCESTAPK
jgi:hypothetical protein